jgi:RND family efflux transporter MFP subunit
LPIQIMENTSNDSQLSSVFEDDVEKPPKLSKRGTIISWSITGVILLGVVIVIIFTSTREATKPAPAVTKLANVEVITISTQKFVESLTLPAIINADRVAGIRPEYSGTLERWFIREGAPVKIGEVVAEINTKALRLNLDELVAALKTASQNVSLSVIRRERAQVNLDNMKKNIKIQEIALASAESNYQLGQKQFDRVQQLAKQQMASEAAMDDAKNSLTQSELAVIRAKQNLNSALLNVRTAELAVKEAKAGVKLAEARNVELEATIDVLEYKIEKGKLRAPFSGRLEEQLIQPGEIVTPNAAVGFIYDLKVLRATINVPDRYVAFLDPENTSAQTFIQMYLPNAQQRIKASLIIPGLPSLTGDETSGIELNAEIARVAQSSDPKSNTFKVELRFPNPGNALKHGIIARSKIEYLYYPDAIIIPIRAVQVTDAGPRVLVVSETAGEQIVGFRDIKPVSIHGSKTFISAGLNQGDRLIVAGWKGLVGGEKVNVLVEDGKFVKPQPK